MEKWELFWRDSEKNIVLARFLLEITGPNMLGLALYHAQQALEMAMKACIFRYGFEDYMRMKRVADNESTLELVTEEPKGKDPTMHHFPLKEMIIPPLEFVEDEVKKFKLSDKPSGEDLEMGQAINEMMKPVKTLKGFILYINSRQKSADKPDPKEELWKFSLGINPTDDKLTEYLNNLRDASEQGITKQFFEASSFFIRNHVFKLYRRLERAHNLLARNKFKSKVEEVFERADIPMNFYHLFFEKDPVLYKQGIQDLVTRRNPWTLLTKLMDPDGILHDIEKMGYNTKVTKINNKGMMFGRFRRNLTWMSYIVAVSVIMIFLLPHEDIGRYQRIINGKTTDQHYLEHRDKVRVLVNQCGTACENIKIILKLR